MPVFLSFEKKNNYINDTSNKTKLSSCGSETFYRAIMQLNAS